MTFVIREAGGVRFTEKLVLGTGLTLAPTAEGAPELVGGRAGEVQLVPTGLDDTKQIQEALARGVDVRLGAGTFRINATLQVGAGGVAQRLIGSGAGATRLEMTSIAPDYAVHLRSSRCGVEALTLWAETSVAALAASVTPGGSAKITGIVLRDLVIDNAETAVWIENPVACSIENLHATDVSGFGVYVFATATECEGLVLRNVRVEAVAGTVQVGVRVAGISGGSYTGITTRGFGSHGVYLSGGAGHHLAGVRVHDSGTGIAVQGTSAVTVEGAEVFGSTVPLVTLSKGILVDGAKEVAVRGCRIVRMPEPVRVQSSENVEIGAVRSDYTGGSALVNPHLKVTSSPGVFVTSFRIVNTGTPPAVELDVAAAGSRVLFGPHNFTAARISSGGFYAAL